MWFYLACVAAFALMLIGLHSCSAGELRATQPGFHKVHGKGGEARRKELHRRRMVTVRRPRHALSAALPRPHPDLNTPQQIIETEFASIGWKR